ncbi:hypothetical protein HYS54_02075 [Candidatus Micrarchaeota archaeon]|nr:hypothetical protein [Candidatus Micrarchaeota archaeon]
MAKKKAIIRRPGSYPIGKATLMEELSLEGTLDGSVNKKYTDEAADDLERGSTVEALKREIAEAKPKKRAKK